MFSLNAEKIVYIWSAEEIKPGSTDHESTT